VDRGQAARDLLGHAGGEVGVLLGSEILEREDHDSLRRALGRQPVEAHHGRQEHRQAGQDGDQRLAAEREGPPTRGAASSRRAGSAGCPFRTHHSGWFRQTRIGPAVRPFLEGAGIPPGGLLRVVPVDRGPRRQDGRDALQFGGHGSCVRRTQVRILLQTAQDQRGELPGQLRPVIGHRHRIVAEDGRDQGRRRRAREGPVPRQHLVHHRADREDIGARIRRPPLELFRRHVLQGADQHARLGDGPHGEGRQRGIVILLQPG